jgi:dolichol-phosphate mannosyltransferase
MKLYCLHCSSTIEIRQLTDSAAPSLSILIPAYNESGTIEATLHDIIEAIDRHAVETEILVINDSSDDNTGEIVDVIAAGDGRVRQLHRTLPRGFGRAVRTGLKQVAGEVVVIVMADQSDDPEDIFRYYQKINEGYDCVFGSRFVDAAVVVDYPPVKRFFNRLMNKLIQVMFWTPFNDMTNAFKAYRREVIQHCGPFYASHFNITIEMSLSALIRKYRIAQIPISWHGRTWGSSKLRLGQMGRRYLCILLKLFFERILISDDIVADRQAAQKDKRD